MFLNVGFLLFLAAVCNCKPVQLWMEPSLSQPQIVPGLGMTPQYHAVVYRYVSNMAGALPPAKVHILPARVEDFGTADEPALTDNGSIEPVTEGPLSAGRPVPSALLPSDFILLTRSPQSQFFGTFDVVKNKNMKIGVNPTALPPLGGVVSNYILLRDSQNEKTQEKVKRQTYYYDNVDDDDDAVSVIASEPRVDSSSTTEASEEDKKEEPQPSVAQSKPAAVALAGVGGVAQAAPVGTAVVGAGGLAIAAPSATAIAGQGTQGAIQIASDEKMKRMAITKNTNSSN